MDQNPPPDIKSNLNLVEIKAKQWRTNRMKFILVLVPLLIILAIALAIALIVYHQRYKNIPKRNETIIESWGKKFISDSILGVYPNAAVTCDADHCSSIGKYFLLVKRGHAVDATIATLLCNGIINMHGMGIGGGGFMLIYNKFTRKIEALNFREKAPLAASRDMFYNKSSLKGLHSIAVPGELAGYYKAHVTYGVLPWSELFQPTINMLENGVPIGKTLGKYLNYMKKFDAPDNLKELFFNSTSGKWLKEGDFYQNKKLAETMKKIASDPRSLYGHMAKTVAEELSGSLITVQDLQDYSADWVEPVFSQLDGSRYMYSLPPPSSGALAIYMINVIKEFYPRLYKSLEDASLFFHRFVETMKFSYAMRSNLGDPTMINMTAISELLNNLTSKAYARKTRSWIDDKKTYPPEHYLSKLGSFKSEGTTHINVIDQNGNAVAVTTSINTLFGSKVLGNITGILYNNEMDDFSIPNRPNAYGLSPSVSNYIAPGKRPMSSMSPILIIDTTDGSVILANGASGGSRITSAVAYTTIRSLFFNETLKEAIDYPRIHHQLIPNCIYHEKNFPEDIITELRKFGHQICSQSMSQSANQAIRRLDDNSISANADYRKGGTIDGF